MADYVELFNRKLVEFIDDLIVTFPDFQDLTVYRGLLLAAVAIDKTSPQTVFNNTVAIPYEAHILEKNEEFLINESYTQSGADQGLVDKLKVIWKGMDADNKEIVWKYMQVLIALNRKCIS
jgi:hypothetical protein